MAMQPYSPMEELWAWPWRDLGRFLGEPLSLRPHGIGELMHRFSRPLDLYETANGYDIHFPIPGAKPESIEVTVHNSMVSINWETGAQTPANARQVWSGIQYGQFQEQFTLPTELDANATGANFENGVLYIHVAKAAQGATKTIRVEIGQGQIQPGQSQTKQSPQSPQSPQSSQRH